MAEPNQQRKTWIAIVIASVVAVCLLALMAIGAAVFFFVRNIDTDVVAPENASAEFDKVIARFEGQTPLIELKDDGIVVHRGREGPPRPIALLRVLAYDRADQQLVTVTIPGWLLRLLPDSGPSISVDGTDILRDARGRLTLGDLERHGPGLVLDGRGQRDAPVLIWTE
jgi:hypothetical protein